MTRKLFAAFLFAAALLWSVSAAAQTQITTGVIQGTVSDPQGAVVPGAAVEVKNLDTNLTRTTTTDGDGRFVALLLPPGRYTVTVGKSGFATVVQENVNLTVGQAISLPVAMKVAGAEERIVVEATPTVEVAKIESSSTINEKTVETTPVLGRKFEDLLTLTPGVSIVQGPDGDEITFNGQRGIFNNISLDGGDYQNGFFGEQLGGQRAAIDITMEAVKEFQVIASGGSAEFGRTAGGIVNVVTKSGTNGLHGSLFHFQRFEGLTSNTSDGKPLTDFHREQTGFTLGGPFVKDKSFFYLAFEHIGGNLQRDNLSAPIGTCSKTSGFDIANAADEALINGSAECQRLALLEFMQSTVGQEEGNPIRRPISTYSVLGKWDWNVNNNHTASASYNFTTSRKVNETFDVATYGNSANGIEGTAKIHKLNFNLVSTFTPRILNEAHFGYSREDRPRAAVDSNVPADTAMGFATTFRFGAPFFLQPGIDELFWRTQLRDNVSIVHGRHTFKMGGEWIHSLNDQVFRGFFTGRYIFDSVASFMRYASPAAAGGFGPSTVACSDGSYVTAPTACPVGTTTTGGPLLLYLQGAGRDGVASDAAGASNITNEDLAVFVQDKWQIFPNFTLSYGLRWEGQVFPDPAAPPADTAYGILLSNPAFPSDGTLPNDMKMWQPRVGIAWDVANNGKSVVRASFGIYNARQNMLSQVGSITTNGLQQQTIFVNTDLIRQGFATAPVWPDVVTPAALPPGTFPLFGGVRIFDRNYRNPRVYTTNFAFEQELIPNLSAYFDFTWAKGVYLTNFLDYNRADRNVDSLGNPDPTIFSAGCGAFVQPCFGEVFVTSSRANSLYRGFTAGLRKRFSNRFQMDMNYTYSKDYDNDSNERDPFTDQSGPANSDDPFNLRQDYSYSDRDIRHKFNLVSYIDVPGDIQLNLRMQGRSAQPIDGPSGRNTLRKDNEFFSFDWRVQRPFRFGQDGRFAIVPIFEMFNTFNNANNINPLTSPPLFDFSGFLRLGVGDPRQAQLAVRFTF